MYNRILKIKDTVKSVLIEFPETRDNDRLLILKVWKAQYPNLANIGFTQFSVMFLDGKFKDSDSITRARRKIQEQHPELKGKNFVERIKEEAVMRDNIKTLNT